MELKYNGNIEDFTLMLKHIMLDKNITQKDIANNTGWTKQTVSNFLNNRTKNPSITVIYEICKGLGCELILKVD